jgi:predicted NodU family carbamoyl transferase
MDHPEFEFPNNLNWGVRKLADVGIVKGLVVAQESAAYQIVLNELNTTGCVNVVRGNMEFGPRALCNTSTLAIPTKAMVDKINQANNRNTVMPMAPVMTMAMYRALFDNSSRLWRSYAHMICAMEYIEHPWESMMGVAHGYRYPHNHHTGRPQVISESDRFMNDLLSSVGHPLINTSFNFHGQPIALGMEQIVKNHVMQYQRDPSIVTVVIQNV